MEKEKQIFFLFEKRVKKKYKYPLCLLDETYIHVFLSNVYLPHYKDLLHYILFIFMVLSEKCGFLS